MSLPPYGGALVDRVVLGSAAAAARERARGLPAVEVSNAVLSDLYLLAVGGLSPLTGFMSRAAYESVLEDMRLPDGLPWSIPVTLPARPEEVRACGTGAEVALVTEAGEVAGLLTVEEVFRWDRDREAQRVYGTRDRAHPGVARLDVAGEYLLAGPIQYVCERDITGFPEFHLTPAATRAEFARRGWRTIVAFQTRNPVHRAHEYLQKCALELVDGLLLHPLVGDTKSDDVPADVRMACYRVLLERYYPRDRVLLSVLPAAMRYAGPREAIFHAVMRRNYGCTHFIVGRDHAGVGNYYGTYDAQRIFDAIDLDKLGIQPLRFEHAYFCSRCQQMATRKTCPHDQEHHIVLSGSKLRELLARGDYPPIEFSRAEVAEVLVRAHSAAEA